MRKKHRKKLKSLHRCVLEGKLSDKNSNKKIDAYICTNLTFLGNASFNIFIDWRDKNELIESDDPHSFWAGKNYHYTLSKRQIVGDKLFNMDEVESEIQSMINFIKERHPNVRIIGQIDALQTIRKDFEGLYYRNK